MKTITLALTCANILVTGCAVNSGIIPAGADIFFVSRQAATGFTGMGNLRPEALQEATQHCSKLGKQFVEVRSTETKPPYILGNYPKVDIEFKCISADFDGCFTDLAIDRDIAGIREKVALSGVKDETFSMLADNTKPTLQEAVLLRRWGEKRDVCMKKKVDYLRAVLSQQVIINLQESTNTASQVQVAELLNGNLSYSAYAKQSRELNTLFNDTVAKIKSELRKETADSVFKANQLAIEAQRNSLMQQSIDNQRVQTNSFQGTTTNSFQGTTTNCVVIGSSIHCRTR